jgi:FKBP-type peptidyl-prolyl cis-trans isomerase SlpA
VSDATTTPVVKAGSFLTLHYRLAGPAGDVINTFTGKPATLSLGAGQLSPAVEERLIGLREGTHTTFEWPAGAAFGERNPDLVHWVARSLLNRIGAPDQSYAVGDVVQFSSPEGALPEGADSANVNGVGRYAGTVLQTRETGVLLDFNHPLAGQPVTFEVALIGVL